MNYPLRVQLLHHAIRNKFVILGIAQALGYGFKCPHESAEVLILVQRAGLAFAEDASAVFETAITRVCGRQRRGVAAAQLRQCGRIDRALEVQVQLGLG